MSDGGSHVRIPSGDLFPTDEPVAPDDLIGRDDDVATVAAALAGNTNLILAEPRRTGKTTVCDAALARLREQGFYTASVDLWDIDDIAELSQELTQETVSNRPAAKRLLHEVKTKGRTVLGSGQVVRTLMTIKSDLGDDIEFAFEPGLLKQDPTQALDYALHLPQLLAERDHKRIIVFFDEFQNIRQLEDTGRGADPEAIQKRMRSVFQRSRRAAFLFAGSMEHLMKDIFGPSDRPFSQFGGFHDLQPITADAWKEGIAERLARDQSKIEPQALDRLVELGELHPRATMLIAQQAHIAAVGAELHTVTTTLIETGYTLALQRDRGKHEQIVERMRTLGGKAVSKQTVKVARRIAAGEQLYGRDQKTPSDIQRAVNALRDAGIIEARAKGRGWRIVDPLLRRYLADRHTTG